MFKEEGKYKSRWLSLKVLELILNYYQNKLSHIFMKDRMFENYNILLKKICKNM